MKKHQHAVARRCKICVLSIEENDCSTISCDKRYHVTDDEEKAMLISDEEKLINIYF
jgi:hypothetical protein